MPRRPPLQYVDIHGRPFGVSGGTDRGAAEGSAQHGEAEAGLALTPAEV
ncbi:MAG: hypothetical protein HXY24_09755, partial [Rubrivivax sp.]|nr:hypothetical protein [Rubrivivax sp.]